MNISVYYFAYWRNFKETCENRYKSKIAQSNTYRHVYLSLLSNVCND